MLSIGGAERRNRFHFLRRIELLVHAIQREGDLGYCLGQRARTAYSLAILFDWAPPPLAPRGAAISRKDLSGPWRRPRQRSQDAAIHEFMMGENKGNRRLAGEPVST